MSDRIMSVPEVFTYLVTQLSAGTFPMPESYALDVRRPPGYGPPDDLVATVRYLHPDKAVTFSSTVMAPPHTSDKVDATVMRLLADVQHRVDTRGSQR